MYCRDTFAAILPKSNRLIGSLERLRATHAYFDVRKRMGGAMPLPHEDGKSVSLDT